jgi:nicotinamide riboside kinase
MAGLPKAFVVAVLGAECTGKTTLAQSLGEQLCARGHHVALVPEYLREFCDLHGRTPLQHEQAGIAREQTRRIEHAASNHDIVIADTTALMTAVYSEIVFGDRSLYPAALADQRRCDLTLLTALDLPWLPDGLQRDGPHVREPVDALVRAACERAGVVFAVVGGVGEQRFTSALAAVSHALSYTTARTAALGESADDRLATKGRWSHRCERCGDAGCESACLPALRVS